MSERTFKVPISNGFVVQMIEVPARTSGVRGLMVTRWAWHDADRGFAMSVDRWVLSHTKSGLTIPGDHTFESIAEARRAAKRIEGFADWNGDYDSVMADLADANTQRAVVAAYRGR